MQHFSRLAEKDQKIALCSLAQWRIVPGLDFSFSGLKTSAANTINQAIKQEGELTEQTKADIAFAFKILSWIHLQLNANEP